MEALLSELQKLSTSKRVIQPEQVILQHLIKFDLLFPQLSNETDFRQLEKALFNLFKINNGNLSVQCSISISFRLTQLYNKMSEPPVASAISDLTNKLTQSSTIAIGEIFNRSGSRCASQIPKAINALILLPDDLRFHSLFALRGIFKTKAQSLSQFCAPVYKFLRKSIDVIPEANQIIALKLIKRILAFDKNYFSNAIECCDSCLLKNQTPFVRFQAGKLAAYCALIQSANSLKDSFTIIRKYTNYLSPIISRFLEILPTSTIIQNSTELFKMIREISPNDINLIISYLTISEKQTLFGTVLSEPKPSPSQLSILNLLIINDSDILSCVSAAIQLGRSNNPRDMEATSFFFSNLAINHPSNAQNVIQSSIVELTKINSEDMSNANSIAVTSIFEKDPTSITSIFSIKQLFDDYINTITALTDYGSMRYSSFWSILSYLPDDFLDQQKLSIPLRGCCELLSLSSTQGQQSSQKENSTTGLNEQKWARLIESLLLFYSKHPKYPHSDLAYNVAQSNMIRLTERSLSLLVDYVISSRRNSDTLVDPIIQKLLKSYPGRDFLKRQIKRNVIAGEDLLVSKNDEIETINQISTQKLIVNFPSLIKCCQTLSKDTIMNNLVSQSVTSSQMLVGHTILLKIVEDSELSRGIPKTFIGAILKTLKGSDFFRIQITCELVSKAIEQQQTMMEALFKFIEMNKRAVSCLLLSAVMCRFHLSDSLLSRAILFIGERIFSHFSAPFALHALSTSLHTQTDTVDKLGIAWQHTNTLLKLMHDATSLHPVIIHLISATFADLLPIISTNIDVNLKNATILDILSIVESIRSSPYSFAKGVFYSTTTILARTSFQIASLIPINFPSSKTTPFQILLSASESYSLIGRTSVSSQIERILVAVERSSKPSQLDAVGQLLSRENGQFLLALIKRVLVNENAAFDIESDSKKEKDRIMSSISSKYVVLKALGSIFDTVTINEAPIIALSLIKCASCDELELQLLALPMLSALLSRFKFDNLQQQFASLLPVAFKLNFNVSGGFLVSFMNKNNLGACIESLSKCTNDGKGTSESPEYVMMFTRALKISREFYDKNVPQFVKNYAGEIHKKLNDVAKLVLKNVEDLPLKANEFKFIWAELWQSVIYLDFALNNKMSFDPSFLISFFIVQARKSETESWIIRGLFYGVAAIIQFFDQKIDLSLIKEAVDTCIYVLQSKNDIQLLEEPAAQICKYASRCLGKDDDNDELWNRILYTVLNNDFEPETAGRCIDHFGTEKVEEFVYNFCNVFLLKIALNDPESCIALFKVLIHKVNNGIDTIINEVIDWSEKTPNTSIFTFRLLTILIKKKISLVKDENDIVNLDYDKISDYTVKRFRRGGINFVANLLSIRKDVGIQIAIRGPAATAAALVTSDIQNASVYIKFLMICTDKIKNEKLSNIMLDIAMKSIINNNLPADLINTCVQIFKIEQKENSEYFKKFWESQDESNRELCIRNILSVSS